MISLNLMMLYVTVSIAIDYILTGLFALEGSLFYGGGTHFFIIQLIGVLSVIAWVSITITIVFIIINSTIGLHVSEEEEIIGLDIEEHNLANSYADFMLVATNLAVKGTSLEHTKVYPEVAVTVEHKTSKIKASDTKITKVDMIIKQNKFDALKMAMKQIGITVTQVIGCGMQKGSVEYYRGIPMDITLLPKVKVEFVICKVPLQTVIETAKKVLYTGNIGDCI